jgi:PilZ domain
MTMALHSLLFAQDQEVVSLVIEVLKSLDIEVTHCPMAAEAIQKLAAQKFDAIVVDNSDARGAVTVLSAAKSLPSCEQSIGVVLATSRNSIGLADGARSHMVLYRPLSADRLRNGIRSALKLRSDGEEARESQRTRINIPASLRGAGQDETLAFINNLSVGGAALQIVQSIPASCIQSVEFSLPGIDQNLSSSVELVWRNVQGQVGVRFVGMSARFTETLEKWLANRNVSQKASTASA